MRLGRLLRRLQARWRLHRIEWNALHRPLEPPPGYEKYYTEEAVFPGLKRTWRKKETWDDYVKSFKSAWKIYRHDFVHDPEVAAMEERFDTVPQRKAERRARAVLKQAERTFKEGMKATDDVVDTMHGKAPDPRQLVRNRVNLLAEAVNEFSQGYRDAVEGRFKPWEEDEDEQDAESQTDVKSSAGVEGARPVDSDPTKHGT